MVSLTLKIERGTPQSEVPAAQRVWEQAQGHYLLLFRTCSVQGIKHPIKINKTAWGNWLCRQLLFLTRRMGFANSLDWHCEMQASSLPNFVAMQV